MIVNGIYEGVFDKNDMMGFQNGKRYSVSIIKPPNSAYLVTDLIDDFQLTLSSEKSLYAYFKGLTLIERD